MHRNRGQFVISAVIFLFLQLSAVAQQSVPPDVAELRAVLEDEERFSQLMTETWVLRDVLALQVGGNISAETKEFQALQDKLRDQRPVILESLAGEQARVELPETVIAAHEKLATTLDSFGVKGDSDLGRRLLAANIRFNQALSAASLGSLCNIHPFRTLCPE